MSSNRGNIWILSFTLAVVMIGYGIIMPVIPFYIERLGASGRELGLLTSISALMQLVFAPFWGNLSDRFGRKPVLLVGVIGYGITMLLFGLANHLWMLFVARALNGILSSATLPTAMAYVSDRTPGKDRSGSLGQLGAAMGTGIVLGPGIGGALASMSLSTPFFVASGLCLAALLLVWFLLPESLPSHPQEETTPAEKGSRIGQVWQALSSPIGVLMLLSFVVSFGLASFQGILGLYALDRFGFSTQQIGWIWVIVGAVMIASQGALTGWLTRLFGEVAVIRLSLLATTISFGCMLLAAGYFSLILTTSFLILSIALLGPALNSLISNRTRLQQGITMGLSNSATSLGRIIGPIWAGSIYDVNVQFPFMSGAAIILIGFFISLLWIAQDRRASSMVPM